MLPRIISLNLSFYEFSPDNDVKIWVHWLRSSFLQTEIKTSWRKFVHGGWQSSPSILLVLQTPLRGSQGCHGLVAGNSSSDKHNLSQAAQFVFQRVEFRVKICFIFCFSSNFGICGLAWATRAEDQFQYVEQSLVWQNISHNISTSNLKIPKIQTFTIHTFPSL